MNRKIDKLGIDRFIKKELICKDFIIVITTIVLFLGIGLFEKNLILPSDDLGLLEHVNIWIFILMNFLIVFSIKLNFAQLKKSLDLSTYKSLITTFNSTSELISIKILGNFARVVGFCFFIGNSLQNAHIINPMSFDYWDSTNYIISYFFSRIYKLYLFVDFIPSALIFVIILIISISHSLILGEDEIPNYPIRNYMQSNALCNFGLNIMITIVIPIICFSSGVYLVHNTFDITVTATIIFSVLSTLIIFSSYIFLVSRFYLSIIKYKNHHIKKIDLELSNINDLVFTFNINNSNNEILDAYLKKEKYLWECKERISKINKFPLIIKAIFTIISPCIPTLIKTFLTFKSFF